MEINYTFRRFPTEKALTAWRELASDGFVFTLKANQRITHSKRLHDVDDDVRRFLEAGKALGDRFGCLLFQCPPNLVYDRALIEGFVGYLPPPGPGTPRFAMEFRHASWFEAKDLLKSQGVAWCVAETDDKDPKPEDLSWEPAGYLRLRKTEYDDAELQTWAERIRPALEGGADVFCYFKHEDEGASPTDGEASRDDAAELTPARWRRVSAPACAAAADLDRGVDHDHDHDQCDEEPQDESAHPREATGTSRIR